MDVRAAFEMGYAAAIGIPIFGFYTRSRACYFERLKNYHGEIEEGALEYRSKDRGLLLEDFGLSDNLMVSLALAAEVHPTFEAALKAAVTDRQAYQLQIEKATE